MVKRISIIVFLVLLFFGEQVFAQGAVFKKVETLMLKDAYPQAAKECEKILAKERQSKTKAQAHYLLGICLLKENEFAQARKNFNIILSQYAQSEFCDDAALGIADSYFIAGDYAQANQYYAQFLQDFPQSELASIAQGQIEQCKQGAQYGNNYFSVQVGCFAQKDNAEKLQNELLNHGYQAYLLKLPGETSSRVRVGRFNDRLEAELLEQRLKTEGYSTKVCP